jgi:hypothetical protein
MPRTRRLLAALALASACASGGCYGSFAVTKSLYAHNQRVDGKGAREGVFLALIIVPVYECALLADLLVFNTIELLSGDNPMHRSELEDYDSSP